MFEQAVYAGRNHTSILAAALTAIALLPAQARADDVAHVALGSSIEALVTGPDGGAWFNIRRLNSGAVGRASVDGRFRTASSGDRLYGGTLGPDGAAWFVSGIEKLARVDPAGSLTTTGRLR